MSITLSIVGLSEQKNPLFQKHLKAVEFCIENELSFPKETSEFFKGRVHGEDLESYRPEVLLNHIRNGVKVRIPTSENGQFGRIIDLSNIPEGVDSILIEIR